jgi:hypothetical protein
MTYFGWLLCNICVTNDHKYVPLFVNTSRSFPHSWLFTEFVTRLTRRVSLVEQELLTLPEHLSSPSVFSGVRVTRSLVLYVCFVDCCLSFCTFFWSLCCLFFFDIWIPITPLVYSNSSYPGFSGVRVTWSLVLGVFECFVDCCLSFCPFSFGHCVVCPSLIYGFWLPLWHLQTLLTI